MISQTILIKEIGVETDPRTTVYQVEIFDDKGSWHETFNTLDLLVAFLRGIRVALATFGQVVLPDLKNDPNALVKFDPQSCFDRLP